MQNTQMVFVDLDRELAGDRDGARFRELSQQLTAGAQRCRAALDKGVSPAEARYLNTVLAAYAAASDLLPKLRRV